MINDKYRFFWNKKDNIKETPIPKKRFNEYSFVNLGYEIIVTDPLFSEYDSKKSWIVDSCKIGAYTVYAKYSGAKEFLSPRISELEIINIQNDLELDVLKTQFNKFLYINRTCIAKNIQSQSGLIGFFNYNRYKKEKFGLHFVNELKDKIPYDNDFFVVEDYGVVCWSGYGPGNYKLHVIKYCGKYIYLALQFEDNFMDVFQIESVGLNKNKNKVKVKWNSDELMAMKSSLKEYDLQSIYNSKHK